MAQKAFGIPGVRSSRGRLAGCLLGLATRVGLTTLAGGQSVNRIAAVSPASGTRRKS
jgi:hypothetical protein